MNSSPSYLDIIDNLAAAIDKFVDDENCVKILMRPKLAGLDKSRWMRIHNCLFDILVTGNDLSFRMDFYREIGQIESSIVRPLCLQIDQHIQDIVTLKAYFRPWVTTDPIFRALEELENTCKLLMNQILKL